MRITDEPIVKALVGNPIYQAAGKMGPCGKTTWEKVEALGTDGARATGAPGTDQRSPITAVELNAAKNNALWGGLGVAGLLLLAGLLRDVHNPAASMIKFGAGAGALGLVITSFAPGAAIVAVDAATKAGVK